MTEWEQGGGRVAKGKKVGGKAVRKPTNRQLVNLALREMRKAVPEIEERVKQRDALAAESRFEAPRTSEITRRKDGD